jgi:uncharacterized protein involved in exopolysaccharide biosynthesis
MKSLARFFIHLYPRTWRARYGEEFQALLEDSPPTVTSLFDLLKGALQMQFSRLTFTKRAVLLSLTGLLLGFAASFLIAPRYISSTELMLTQAGVGPAQHANLSGQFLRMESEILSRSHLSRIIQDPRLDLYKSERQVEPLEDVIENMRRKNIRIQPVTYPGISGDDTLVFMIEFGYTDAHIAQAVVQTLVTNFQEINLTSQRKNPWEQPISENDRIHELEARIDALEQALRIRSNVPLAEMRRPMLAFNLAVLDPPSYPELPASPNRYFFSACGFTAGFTLAVFISLFRRRIPPPAVALPA